MSLIKKLISRIKRRYILKLNPINVKLYMKMYNKWLRNAGMKIAIYDGVGYIDPSVYFDGSDFSRVKIGRNVTISKDVMILTHDYSIWNGLIANNIENEKRRYSFIKPVIIGNNCFIGAKAIILPGSDIGNNVIVGAGSVIKGVIPNNTIWVGNPAKQIMSIEEFTKKHERLSDYIEG